MRCVGRTILFLAAGMALSACAGMPIASAPAPERAAISATLMRDISVLASDEYGGRRPGTDGEAKTVGYITQQLEAAGFESGTNDPGNAWRAPVPLISTRPAQSRMAFRKGRRLIELDEQSASAFTSGRRALVEGADMVFVGSLADEVAEGDISGRVVVMLGEPGVSPGRRAILFDKNPAAILTVVDDSDAIANTRRVFGRERLLLASEETQRVSGFLTHTMMSQALGHDVWEDMVNGADEPGFEPLALDMTATIEATSVRREFTSANVIGRLPGAKPGSGAILLMGHWDHLGECGSEGSTDLICNGAIDNASGIAVMLELARRLASQGPFDRDIYVLATSAEEAGLLGAKAFIEAPPIPLDTIVAAFNFDTVALAPEGSKVGFVGEGRTALDSIIKQVLEESERELGDKKFAESFVQRQDGWALLQEGVPAVMLSTAFSSQIVLGPYLSSDYHRPSDEIEKIELGGAIDDLLLHEELIRRIADTTRYPATGG